MDQLRTNLFRSLVWIALAWLLFGPNSARGESDDELVSEAKKEGKVMFWSSMRVEDSRELVAGFEAKYPFIKVEIYRAGGEQLVNRALTESAAAKTTYDVINAFALKVVQDKGLLRAYPAPEAAHYPTGFKDPQHYWVSLYSGYSVIGYNSKLVAHGEAPKDWGDLLSPRWKGKLAMDNEEYFWHAGMLKYWGEEKGKRYMDSLARQDVQWRSGHALLADLMSVGEFPVVVVVYPDQVEQMKAKGQPVEWVKTSDPILVNLAPIAIAAKAPHPASAKLFMNYSISKEGQNILRKRNRISARGDVPPLVPDMDPKRLRLVPLDPSIPTNTEHVKDFRKAFGLL